MRLFPVLFLLASCKDVEPQGFSCLDIGCSDALNIALRAPDNTSQGSWATVKCEPALRAEFHPETLCSEQRSGSTASQTCTPVPDHWLFDAHPSGTPAALAVRVARDGDTIFEANRTPEYSDSNPNGPGCGPACRQASIQLTLD